MIVEVVNCPDRPDAWIVRDKSGERRIESHHDYFPQAVLDATPKPGDRAYFEAEFDPETGDVSFGKKTSKKQWEAAS